MTTRPLSQIIADLKATCVEGSDVWLLCEFAEQVRADWKEIEREAESEDGADQQRYLRGLFGHMIRQRKACAKLHEQIKEFKHDLQLATNNAAACMRVANERQEELNLVKEALRWALENRAGSNYVGGLRNGGCGCCSYDIEPPAHLEPIFRDVLGANT